MARNPLSSEARTLRSLRRLPLVSKLDNELWNRLLPHLTISTVEEGEFLFQTGSTGNFLYLIIEGELGLYIRLTGSDENFFLQTRVRGDTAGDFAVLNGGKHLVSSMAHKKTRLACFPAFAFELLADIEPSILAHVYNTAASLSHKAMLARVYMSLLGEMHSDKLDHLLEETHLQYLETGETLFERGDEADGLHIVVSGRLRVESIGRDNKPLYLGEVFANQSIGEFALLAEPYRTATVYATRHSSVARLSREQFESVILDDPKLTASLARMIVKRQMYMTGITPLVSDDQNFVVIPLQSSLPLKRFVQQLKREFTQHHNPLVMDANSFDVFYGKKGASQTGYEEVFSGSIAAWMDDKENYHSHLVYVTDHSWSNWTRRCVNRADRILLVAHAVDGADTELSEIELQLQQLYDQARYVPRIELVILHPSDTAQPSGTKHWLTYRTLDAFHHIRLDDSKHIARLVRRMTGQSKGLVFSGGGARGFAHLGVQRAIEEHGMEIDYIGGASMGGLLGGAMALGLSYKEVYDLCRRFANARALFDYTLPLTSLMRSAKLSRFCHEVYKDTRIEDLWIPFFCVSSNLTDGKEVLHDRGYLRKAIRSTISLPGIFSPVPTLEGGLLVDGAVLNTFPVSIMRERMPSGRVIGVNVSQLDEVRETYHYGTSLSGWRLLWSRLNPFAEKHRAPKIAEILLRSTDIKSIEKLNETRETLEHLLEPDVSEIALLDFKSFKKISEIGYTEACKVLFDTEVHNSNPAGSVPLSEIDQSRTNSVSS